MLQSCYHPDAYDDHGMFQGPAADFITYAVGNLSTMSMTMHTVHNVTIELTGDAAAAETYCIAYHRMPSGDDAADHLVGVRYLDRLERRDGGPWLIAHRSVVYEWSRIDPVGRQWRMRPEYARPRRDRGDASYPLLAGLSTALPEGAATTSRTTTNGVDQ